jgi:hypothetical protein
MLSADEIAVAIIAACDETGADPVDVARGHRPTDADQRRKITRARYYAAFALYEHFPALSASSVGRMVGSAAPDSLISNINRQLAEGSLKWWSKPVLARVCGAIERHQWNARVDRPAPPPKQDTAPPASVGRPFISKRQADAYRSLQDAVQNTARLPKEPKV